MNIINKNGKPNFGLWTGEIHEINTPLYNKFFLRSWREKRWQYIGLYGQDAIVGLAILHTGYMGNMFFYALDRHTGDLIELDRKIPFGIGIDIERNVAKGISKYDIGEEHVLIENCVKKGYRRIKATLQHDGKDIDIDVCLYDDMKKLPPLQTVTHTKNNDFTFTHKSAGLHIEGLVKIGTKGIFFNKKKDFGAIDYTFGFPAYNTVWNWVSMAGPAEDRTEIGVNLVSPVFHDEFNENGIWINGKLIKTSDAIFTFDPTDTLKEWQIRTRDDKVNLIFTPLGQRKQDINFGIIVSRFQQPCGIFSGEIHADDKTYIIKEIPGVVEDHYALW